MAPNWGSSATTVPRRGQTEKTLMTFPFGRYKMEMIVESASNIFRLARVTHGIDISEAIND